MEPSVEIGDVSYCLWLFAVRQLSDFYSLKSTILYTFISVAFLFQTVILGLFLTLK